MIDIEEMKRQLGDLPHPGIRNVKIMISPLVEKGEPMLLCHPDDFEYIKSMLPAAEPSKEPSPWA